MTERPPVVSPPQDTTTEVMSPRSRWSAPRSIALSVILHAFFAWLIFDSLSVDAVQPEEQQEDLEAQVVAVVQLPTAREGPTLPTEATNAPLPIGDRSTPTANDQLALGAPDAGAEPAAPAEPEPQPLPVEPEVAVATAPELSPLVTEPATPAETPPLEPELEPAQSEAEPPVEAPEAASPPAEASTTPPSEAEPVTADAPPAPQAPDSSSVESTQPEAPEQQDVGEPQQRAPQETEVAETPPTPPAESETPEAPPEEINLAEPPPAVIAPEEEAPIADEIVPPQAEEAPPLELAALPEDVVPSPEAPAEEAAPSEEDLTLETASTALVLDSLLQEPEEIEEPGVPLAVPPSKPRREVTLPEPQRPARQTATAPRQSNQAAAATPRSNQGSNNRGSSGNEGRTGSSRGTAGGTVASYTDLVANHLDRKKRCPDGSDFPSERAAVVVRFAVDSEGWVISQRILRSSGSRQMEREIGDLLVRASPLPPPPISGDSLTINVHFACWR